MLSIPPHPRHKNNNKNGGSRMKLRRSYLLFGRRECVPSDANVCRALCHNTAFIFTYDPQITHSKQIGNRKQTLWKT